MKRILVTDDEEVLRMLIVDTLEEEEYEIDEAANGEEALELLEKNNYELLILDYMMPQMTGIEVLQEIRQRIELKHQKVLMLTAKSQAKDKEEMLNSGADSILTKPFSPLELLDTVEELTRD